MRILGSCLAAFALWVALPAAIHAATVTCGDGTTTKARRGACSHHGGVAAGAPAPDTGEKPAKGTVVRCEDGTTSKPGRGACGRHGGVADATLAPKPPAPRVGPPRSGGD